MFPFVPPPRTQPTGLSLFVVRHGSVSWRSHAGGDFSQGRRCEQGHQTANCLCKQDYVIIVVMLAVDLCRHVDAITCDPLFMLHLTSHPMAHRSNEGRYRRRSTGVPRADKPVPAYDLLSYMTAELGTVRSSTTTSIANLTPLLGSYEGYIVCTDYAGKLCS
jgi:hypothetical protein